MTSIGVTSEPADEWEFFRLCPICRKAFVKDNSFKRHLSYCRRAQFKRKGRPKPCDGCTLAKTKCSLEEPACQRCRSKDLLCVYGAKLLEGLFPNPDLQNGIPFGNPGNLHLEQMVAAGVPVTSLTGGSDPLPEFDSHLTLPQSSWPLTSSRISNGQEGVAEPTSATSESLQSLEVLPLDEGAPVQSTEAVDEPATLTALKQPSPEAEASATIVMHCIRSYPQMMLRRQTFPPFIHPHWHTEKLPENLVNCMSIAQLFVTRTPENSSFLWRTIDNEVSRFKNEAYEMDARVVQTAAQAILIYLIMLAVDEAEDMSCRGVRLLEVFQILSFRTRDLCSGIFLAPPECTHPSPSWEEWIFAESRRRINCFYFAVREVIQAKADIPCVPPGAHRQVALCSAKTIWEARSREEWEEERAIQDMGRLHIDLWSLGALLDAQRHPEDPMYAQLLEIWGANTDKMGVLMSVVAVIMNQQETQSEEN
ncbi:unnamed protein product [Clonostachys chloroleuca]|uniref:Zn(2)-C6 fungal-type domain-containing protein n=1 Tax=Clonostachys chloroleuca TaxID=1926264 RepID=A0AA35QFB7_9HYPO|nr:unnamed protein product [Clonostachys chloroleuca]